MSVARSKNDSDYVSRCQEALRESGARITQPRLAVLRCLAHANESMTPREIYDEINKGDSDTKIDQVSVYRILQTLEEAGLVHQVFPSGGYVACEHVGCKGEVHVLLRCQGCGVTQERDIPSEVFAPLRWFFENRLGFSPVRKIIQIDGSCSSCGGDRD